MSRPDTITHMAKLKNLLAPARLCCWLAATTLVIPSAVGAEKKPGPVPIYRMSQLEDAKKRAAAEGKPIAWIASRLEYLGPYNKSLMGKGSHAATAYAIRALQNDAVLVFSDGATENHQQPQIVDQALHSPKAHYDSPGVIILTPALDKVIAKVFYIADSQERIKAFTEILKQIRDKDSWREKTPSK
jgi:hypothetical protein